MRYFKYRNTDKNLNEALKAQYKSFTQDQKTIYKKNKFWSRLGATIFLLLLVVCISVSVWLIKKIPLPTNKVWNVVVTVGKAFAITIAVVASMFVSAFAMQPCLKKAEMYNVPRMTKKIFSQACQHLREYYGLNEPYVITKCFSCTDSKFAKHDVCIFVANGELRITADLVSGFLYGERDLGCYAFSKDEIAVAKIQNGNALITELTAGDTVFTLGYRAISFICKHFLVAENDVTVAK